MTIRHDERGRRTYGWRLRTDDGSGGAITTSLICPRGQVDARSNQNVLFLRRESAQPLDSLLSREGAPNTTKLCFLKRWCYKNARSGPMQFAMSLEAWRVRSRGD